MPPTQGPFQIALSPATAHLKPHPKAPKVKLRLEFRDLSDPGAAIFLHTLDCAAVLSEAVNGVLNLLFPPHADPPSVRSITLVLRRMPGVAYTTGSDIDDDHKEIHFSTDYIAGIDPLLRKTEMLGVVRHEMVHCWQYNAKGTAPGGLIEGVADYVRLRSDFVPPHWSRDGDGDWDAGYQHTGYFLDYLENRYGHGSIMELNQRLCDHEYEEERLWNGMFGHSVQWLWKAYGKSLHKGEEDKDGADSEEASDEATHAADK